MADGGDSFVYKLRALAGVLAPTTVITALLFWFGYVSTVAEYHYFGVPMDVVNLSTQELLLDGVEVMYVPLVLALVVVLALTAAHAAVSWVLASPARDFLARWLVALAAAIGVVLLFRSMIGILVPRVAETEYPGATPLALSLGPLCLAYGAWILRTVVLRRVDARGTTTWLRSRSARQLAKVVVPAVAGVLVAGLFWAVNTFAAAYGGGRGEIRAERLAGEPEVVLDTADRLVGLAESGPIQESTLPAAEDEIFRYRYAGLRLLTESDGRLFLVPAQWRAGDGWTLVVQYDDRIRLRLIP